MAFFEQTLIYLYKSRSSWQSLSDLEDSLSSFAEEARKNLKETPSSLLVRVTAGRQVCFSGFVMASKYPIYVEHILL